jgi:hypothetical protein
MIVSEFIKIKRPNGISYKHYKDLGYDMTIAEIEVKIDHLPKTSRYRIDAKCDYCDNIKHISYGDYYKITNGGDKYACSDCNRLKYKDNCIKKYGVDNTFQLESVKEKIKETNLSKYGLEYHTKSEEFKSKVKEIILNKYGVENVSQLEDVKNKVKKTNLVKFGAEYVFYSKEFRGKYYKIDSDENQISYIGNGIHLFRCDKGHNFEISNSNYYGRLRYSTPLCTICYPIGENRSIKEQNLFDYIKSIYIGNIIKGYKDTFEIDIYLPELKIGFEFNGLYWHSEKFVEKNYHFDKTNFFNNKGIKIIHIWEDDWDYRQNIIKSIIKNKINLTDYKIFARKCDIRDVNYEDCKLFLNKNHIQGVVNNSFGVGLYYNNELVSLMTFDHFEGRKKMINSWWNLNRFCNRLNTSVIGGASRLLKYFILKCNPDRIISYADRSWSNGGLYDKIGFNKLYYTAIDYKYLNRYERVHKSRYRKSKTNISESKIDMLKIYDCGKIKYEMLIEKNLI